MMMPERDPKGRRRYPVAIVEHHTITETSFKKAAVWKIGQVWELNHGRLNRIDLKAADYTHPRFRLLIMGKILFPDLKLVAALTLTFPENELPRGEEVKIECRSDDGTSIEVNASITGAEY